MLEDGLVKGLDISSFTLQFSHHQRVELNVLNGLLNDSSHHIAEEMLRGIKLIGHVNQLNDLDMLLLVLERHHI